MKKIDLHIHTKKTISDANFTYSFETLKNYVKERKLDCIAITNHNSFDLEQFKDIEARIGIVVLPGVEVDLEGGHLLIIATIEKLQEFSISCIELEKKISNQNDTINYQEFRNIFPNTSDYLLIPHYLKKPALTSDIINMFGQEIFAGEVKSIRDFGMAIKSEDMLIPVLFSDLRADDSEQKFSLRQTYIDTEELYLNDIKLCLKDRNKVSLTEDGGHKLIQIFEDGFVASSGLNIILGGRSSGKTMTLKKINENFKDVKYIKQFSLVEKDEIKEGESFKNGFKIDKNRQSENYLKEFKEIVDNIIEIDEKNDIRSINRYIDSLKKYAFESDRHDSYAKAKLFTEDNFIESDNNNLFKLINSVELIIENKEYESIVNKYIDKNNLKKLIQELILEYRIKYRENLYKEYVNTTVNSIKLGLKIKTSIEMPQECNFNEINSNFIKINKFNYIVENLKVEKEIGNTELYNFAIQSKRQPMKSVKDIKDTYGKLASFAEAFSNYSSGFDYLTTLKKIGSVPETELYKLFVKIEYKILNKYKLEVSGGERAEFNLLNELNRATEGEMLLIDEPESSFDNIFLNTSVNSMLKKISETMPVFVVTHNSTVGESIKPDYIIYTQRTVKGTDATFSVYGGHPNSKNLIDVNGNFIDNFTITIDSLEGGKEIYDERNEYYEILENKRK